MHKAIFIKLRVLHMLFVVVTVVMDLYVGFSVFTSTTLVLPAGTLAPPYHLNIYMYIIFIKVMVLTIVFMVVTVVVALVVVLSLLMVQFLLLVTGTVAPPYHLIYKTNNYFYQSSGTRYAIRGGYSSYSSQCGLFCVNLGASFSWASWAYGASLSSKPVFFIVIIFIKAVEHIMLFVVVVQAMDHIVVFSVFTSATTLVLQTGALAPPYHLNRYMFIYNINKFNREELFLNE